MNPRHKALAWTAGAIAVGIAAVFALRGIGGDEAQAPDVAPTAMTAAPVDAEPAAPAPPAMEPAPWEQAQPAPGPGNANAAGGLAGAIGMPQQAATSPAATRAQLATIREQSQRNIAMVDGLLRELDALETSGKAEPGMQLDALRDNLTIARRAQVLALELADSTQQPDSPSRRQRTSEIVAELQQLQGRLRYDMAPAVPGSPAVPAPPAAQAALAGGRQAP